MRAWAPAIAATALLLQSSPAFAQGKPASGDVGFIGLPEYTSSETGVGFFSKADAQRADDYFGDARNAIAKCDRQAYDRANFSLQIARVEISDPNPAAANAKAHADYEAFQAVRSQLPPFPNPCNRPVHQGGDRSHPYSFALLGGGMVNLANSANVTGVDTFTPGNFLIDNRSTNSAGAVTGMFGMRAALTKQLNAFVERQLQESKSRNAPYVSVFVETGIQTAFGANSLVQSFQNVNTTPQGTGQQTVRENVQVPLLVGLSIPLTDGTVVAPPFLNIYGGVTFDSWTHSIAGREGGAPNGPGFNASNSRFTADPTAGVGLRVPINPRYNFWIGLNTEVQFRPGSVVQAQSPNFPSQTYYGTIDSHANVLVFGQIGWSFGSR